MKTIANILKHDFKKGNLSLYDSNENLIYFETSNEYWSKREYDSIGNETYYEDSSVHWIKREYDSNGNRIYFEDSNGYIIDDRPKSSCGGKVVEIDGKTYKLVEINKEDETTYI